MNKRILTSALGVAASLLFGVTTLQADTFTTTVSTSAPTENVVISHTPARGTWGYGWSYSRHLGQVFTVTEGFTLDQIVISIYTTSANTGGQSFQLSLYEFNGTLGDVDNPLIPVATLYNGSSTLPGQAELAEDALIYFDLPDLNLESGKIYGFALQFDATGPNINLNVGNGYAGGSLISAGTGDTNFVNPTADNRLDMKFYVTAAAVPESSTHALLMGGILVAVGVSYSRRRRRQ